MNLSFETVTSFTHGGSGLPAVAVAGAADDAVLGAVDAGLAAGIGFFLVGNNDEILKTAGKHGLNLGDAVIVDSKNSDEAEICRIAAGLCAEGKAGVLMKGLVGTASFTRAILDKEIGLTEKGSLLSHIGFFAGIGNGKAFLMTDAAINILPDVTSKNLGKRFTSVVLPAPEPPTNAIRSPAFTSNTISFNTGVSPYENPT